MSWHLRSERFTSEPLALAFRLDFFSFLSSNTVMRALRPAGQALRLASSSSTQQYVCRACRAHAARQFHTSTPDSAELPFYKRLQNTLFGSKESQEAQKSREEKQRQRSAEVQARDDAGEGPEIKTSKSGKQYEVAAIVEPGTHEGYVPATNWDGLERVGNTDWVKAKADQGEQYVGFVPKRRVDLSNRQWEMLLHHVMVEALVLQKAGRPAGQVCYPRAAGSNVWMHTRNGTIQPSAAGGGVNVVFTDPQAEQQILQAIPQELQQPQDERALFGEVEGAVAQGELAGQQAEAGKQSGFLPPAWMDVSIQDPTLKMAVSFANLFD